MMMGYASLLGGLLSFFVVLGFAYIVWIMAMKEEGWIKTTGLVFACGIAVIVLLLAIYTGFGSRSYMGGKGMRKYNDMGPGSRMHERMEKKMNTKSK